MKILWLLFVLLPIAGISQIKAFDKLEMLYDQAQYSTVLRKANHLLDNPEYDFSLLPKYYKSISLLQLYKNNAVSKKSQEKLEEAKRLFIEVKSQDQKGKLFAAHYYEMLSLKKDLLSFLEQSKLEGNEKTANETELIVKTFMKAIEDTSKVNTGKITKENMLHTDLDKDIRAQLVDFAEKYLGSPYKYGGETPNGFDCSGFTSFVLHEFGKNLPRMSSEQYKEAKKLKIADAQPGDLVFFDSGSGINHVGIIVSNNNGIINMIHSSTSSGVIITNIADSSYWKKRLKAVGSFL
jgi:cell wall-associated NlpC family hydrolase